MSIAGQGYEHLEERLRVAIERKHAIAVQKVGDEFEARGWTYKRIYELARALTGIDIAEWDAFMAEDEDDGGEA